MTMAQWPYPETRRDESVVDDYHGTPVPDPYRWLEDPQAEEVRTWGDAQAKFAFDLLAEMPARAKLQQGLTALWNSKKFSAPERKGERYFLFRNDGLQNQDVFVIQESLDSEMKIIIDPNTFSDDGTIALSNYAISPDGERIAYATSSGGTDWQSIRVRQVDTGREFDETLEWVRFTGFAWSADNNGFFYSRYPETDDREDSASTLNAKVYYHKLGTAQSDDKLIFERPDQPEFGFSPIMSHDDAFLFLYVWHGAVNRNRLYYRLAESDGEFVRLFDEADAEYDLIDVVDGLFYILTDKDAPKKRVVIVDPVQPDVLRDLIPEGDDAIAFCRIVNRQLVVVTLHNAYHQITLYSLNGEKLTAVQSPTLGTISQLRGEVDQAEFFILFESFLFPPTVYRYDFGAEALSPVYPTGENATFDPSNYETRQVFYPSKDGTSVSMFVSHKKGIAFDGENRTLLYGYGGFSIPLTPFYQPHVLNWLQEGGVFAVANLRGGSEYGEAWHQAGMLGNKQNVFDDFISAGEWLIAQKVTRQGKLAIMGRSNGGLLVAAVMLQRPELFGAVICNVPVTDMLRYHKFTAGRYWTAEYGDAEASAEHFAFMLPYSPVHNVKEGTAYPPTLILSADLDDRVVPMHAKKFAALLQRAQSADAPILLRLDTRSGHGHGKPTAKWIEEWADIQAFLMQYLV